MTPLAALADPAAQRAALAWHRSQPRGSMHGEFNVERARGLDPSELPMPAKGTAVSVIGGPRDGLRGWIWRRKDSFSCYVRSLSGERVSIHLKRIRIGPDDIGPIPEAPPAPRRPNRYGFAPGARAQVVGGKHKGRFGDIVKCAGINQVWLRLDDGRRIAPSVHYVRQLP
jgi:hypothetical protein